MIDLAYILAAVLAWNAIMWLYVLAHGFTARATGIQVEELSVGIGPRMVQRRVGGWLLTWHWIPFGGSARFRNEDSDREEPVHVYHQETGETITRALSFQEASAPAQLAVALSGPLANVALGLLLLALPILVEPPALHRVPAEASAVHPCAVGGLVLQPQATTWESQGELFRATALEFLYRLIAFQSLEGWGGQVGFFITCGPIGALSFWAFLTSLGTVTLANGLLNLLPVPPLDGNAGITIFLSEERARGFLDLFRTQGFAMMGLIIAWVLFYRISRPLVLLAINALYYPLVSYG